MVNLEQFVLNEGRGPGRPRKNEVQHDPEAVEIVKKGQHVEYDKDGEGVHGVKQVRVDNSPINNVKLPKDLLNRNMKRLLMKFRTAEDFLILGRAGWGKTSVIKNLGKKFGYEVLPPVILSSADPTDLGGRPYNDKNEKTGHWSQGETLPAWAEEIYQNPDKKYLVFFDELNHAPYDVWNPLMNIILEHEVARIKLDNFFIGAAGNVEGENVALQDINNNKSLKARLLPIIYWETNTPAAWHNAFVHLHEKYDKELGSNLVEAFEKNPDIFDNPRNIEKYFLAWILKLKKNAEKHGEGSEWWDDFDVEDFEDRILGVVEYSERELTRSEEDDIKVIAEKIYNALNDKVEDEKEEEEDSRNKSMDMIAPSTMDSIKTAMRQGFLSQKENGQRVKYGISRENIGVAVDPNEVNAEMLERIIAKFEADGIKFKYEKDSEWKKEGYKDPLED